MRDIMREATSQLISEIEKKRNKIITERLKEIVGIDINIEEEAKRRFKSLAIEYIGDEERIYFNDGSVDGKLIVTFAKTQPQIELDPLKTEISVAYNYY